MAESRMIDISTYLTKIKNERYASDMRDAIHNAIKGANENAKYAAELAIHEGRPVTEILQEDMDTLEAQLQNVESSIETSLYDHRDAIIQELNRGANVDVAFRNSIDTETRLIGKILLLPGTVESDELPCRLNPGETIRVSFESYKIENNNSWDDASLSQFNFTIIAYGIRVVGDERSTYIQESDLCILDTTTGATEFTFKLPASANFDYYSGFSIRNYGGSLPGKLSFNGYLQTSLQDLKIDINDAFTNRMAAIYDARLLAKDVYVGASSSDTEQSKTIEAALHPYDILSVQLTDCDGDFTSAHITVYGVPEESYLSNAQLQKIREFDLTDITISDLPIKEIFSIPQIHGYQHPEIIYKDAIYSGFYITVTGYEGLIGTDNEIENNLRFDVVFEKADLAKREALISTAFNAGEPVSTIPSAICWYSNGTYDIFKNYSDIIPDNIKDQVVSVHFPARFAPGIPEKAHLRLDYFEDKSATSLGNKAVQYYFGSSPECYAFDWGTGSGNHHVFIDTDNDLNKRVHFPNLSAYFIREYLANETGNPGTKTVDTL